MVKGRTDKDYFSHAFYLRYWCPGPIFDVNSRGIEASPVRVLGSSTIVVELGLSRGS
jgi:hypothetical protein